MICAKCGETDLTPSDHYCPNCGMYRYLTPYTPGNQKFDKRDNILTCGRCSNTTFFISERGNVACEKCRGLMEPTPWENKIDVSH